MKKILIILFISLIFVGCNNDSNKINYLKIIENLESTNKFTDKVPFDVDIKITKVIDSEISYKLIIDNVKEDITNLEALIIHDQKTEDIYPSIGIFDEKISLMKEDISTKGIMLIGYIDSKLQVEDFHAEFRIYLKYKVNGKEQTKYLLKQI